MTLDDLLDSSATRQLHALTARDASAAELLEATIDRIEQRNPTLNAIVTCDFERARQTAAAIDAQRAGGAPVGALAGLPMAIKDTEHTQGLRTTYGSPLYRDLVPEEDSAMVARLRRAGVVILGKTNTPELGLGSHTFNTLFGATHNPWHPERSAGGSSGGAAAAVAARLLPFADGSDFGGSLRNPASFNHLIGLRTNAGRIARTPVYDAFAGFTVAGPLARNAEDAALLVAAMSGYDARDPLSFDTAPDEFTAPLERDFNGTKVAYSPTLGGLPVAAEVRAVLDAGIARLEALGCVVEEAEPACAGWDEAFENLRALQMAGQFGTMLKTRRSDFKADAQWNIEAGLALGVEAIAAAQAARTRIFHQMRAFLSRYTFLVAPASQVAPFPIAWTYPTEIDGQRMRHYLEWMRASTRISITGFPAASIPAGFTREGLPVGMQVVGHWRAERSILQLAHALDQLDGLSLRRPPAQAELQRTHQP